MKNRNVNIILGLALLLNSVGSGFAEPFERSENKPAPVNQKDEKQEKDFRDRHAAVAGQLDELAKLAKIKVIYPGLDNRYDEEWLKQIEKIPTLLERTVAVISEGSLKGVKGIEKISQIQFYLMPGNKSIVLLPLSSNVNFLELQINYTSVLSPDEDDYKQVVRDAIGNNPVAKALANDKERKDIENRLNHISAAQWR